MAELEFFFEEVLDELETIKKLADPFIRKQSQYVLPRFQDALKSIRDSGSDRVFAWEIPDQGPLQTITSFGKYEQLDRRGSEHIFAELTCSWSIARVKTKKKEKAKFRLKASPSTRIRVKRDSKGVADQEIAMWRVEIGDDQSPGCHFHIQVRGQDKKHPFPRSVCIPRFPSLFATPMVTLDYVLGELFQEDWRKRVSEGTGATKMWHSIQSSRLTKLFKWHQETVLGGSGSPWILLKMSKPDADLFLKPA